MPATATKPNTFAHYDAMLQGRNATSRKLANNTYANRRGQDIAITLHSTDIVLYHIDGSITLNTGGWNTMTTRDRLHAYSPFRVGTERGTLYVTSNGKRYRFHDGITFGPRGGCKNPLTESATSKQDSAKQAKRAEIDLYVAGWIENAVSGQMPVPSCGDCWSCCMGLPGTDHLESHIEESYYVPSLLVLALKDKGYPNIPVAIQFIMGLGADATGERIDATRADIKAIRKILVQYLRKNMGA